MTPGSLLAAPPTNAQLHRDDPEASAPAKAPEGASPLPAGTPNPTTEGMLRWVATIVFAIVLFGVLAKFVGAPALQHVTPRPRETPAATAPDDAAAPSPAGTLAAPGGR